MLQNWFVRRPNFIWVAGFWFLLSIFVRPGWLAFSAGTVLCLVLMLLKAPGEFWYCLATLPVRANARERWLVRSARYQPSLPHPYIKLGIIYFRRQQWAAAAPLLKEGVALYGRKCPLDFIILLATAYCQCGEDHLAVTLLENVSTAHPNSADVFYHLAVCHVRLGNLSPALEAANKSHALNPDAVRPMMIVAYVHFRHGNFSAAKREYEWLVSTLPKAAESLYWLGRAELELGEAQAAAEHLRLALERLGPDEHASNIPLKDVRRWLNAAKAVQAQVPTA